MKRDLSKFLPQKKELFKNVCAFTHIKRGCVCSLGEEIETQILIK